MQVRGWQLVQYLQCDWQQLLESGCWVHSFPPQPLAPHLQGWMELSHGWGWSLQQQLDPIASEMAKVPYSRLVGEEYVPRR